MLSKIVNEELQKERLVALKNNVAQVLKVIQRYEKKYGKTKKSKKVTKLMNEFISCYLSCPTIIDKYNNIVQVMGEYVQQYKNESTKTISEDEN